MIERLKMNFIGERQFYTFKFKEDFRIQSRLLDKGSFFAFFTLWYANLLCWIHVPLFYVGYDSDLINWFLCYEPVQADFLDLLGLLLLLLPYRYHSYLPLPLLQLLLLLLLILLQKHKLCFLFVEFILQFRLLFQLSELCLLKLKLSYHFQ